MTTALQTTPKAGAVAKRTSVLASMAARYNVESHKLLETLKNTAFKGATDEQMVALCIVADQYRLNPFTKEIYAFPDKKTGGIIPVVGVDGWFRIINDHKQFDGMDVVMDIDGSECTVTVHRKDREHPIVITEYLDECIRGTEPWKTHPKRMLRHKAIIQCARAAFGFSVKDPDEAERIIEAEYEEQPPAFEKPKPKPLPVAQEPETAPKEAAKRKPAPKPPAEPPQDSSGAVETVTGVVEVISKKATARGNDRWSVKIGDMWYNAFKSELVEGVTKGQKATLYYQTNAKGFHDIVKPPQEAPAPEPEQAPEAGEGEQVPEDGTLFDHPEDSIGGDDLPY